MNKRHVMLLIFCVLFFTYQYGLRSAIPNVLNEDLQNYFSANASQIGFLVSLFYLAYTVMQIPVGLIMDRVSVRKIAISSFALFAVGIIGFISSSNFTCAAIAQLFLGASASFAFILVMKVTNDYFPREKVAFVSGVAISAGSLGPVIGSPLLAHLSSVFPWKNVVLFFGFFGIFFALIGLFLIREKDLIKSEVTTDVKSVVEDLKTVLSDYRYMGIGIFSMAILGPSSSFCDAWGVSFVTHSYGVSREQASFAVSFVYAGTIVGGPLVAYLSELLNSYKKVMLGGAVCFATLLSIVSFIQLPLVALYITLFAMGVAATCQFLVFPLALSLGDKKLGATVTGIVNTITMLGCTILIGAVGYILDWSKGANLAYSAADYRCGMMVSVASVIFAICVLATTKLKK